MTLDEGLSAATEFPRCSNCSFANEKWNEGNFIKTYTCANEQAQDCGKRVRPQHYCPQFEARKYEKAILKEYTK